MEDGSPEEFGNAEGAKDFAVGVGQCQVITAKAGRKLRVIRDLQDYEL